MKAHSTSRAVCLPILLLAAASAQAAIGIAPGAAPAKPPPPPAASTPECTGLSDNLACQLRWISRVEVRATGELAAHRTELEKAVRQQLKLDLEGVGHDAPDPAATLRAVGGRREAPQMKQRGQVACALRALPQARPPVLALACELSGWGRYGAPHYQRFSVEALYPQSGPPLSTALAALRDASTRLVIQFDKAREGLKALRDWR